MDLLVMTLSNQIGILGILNGALQLLLISCWLWY